METKNTLTKGFKNFLKPHILALSLSIMGAPSAIADNNKSNLISELNSINTSFGIKNSNITKNNITKFLHYLKVMEEKYNNIDLNNDKQLLSLLRDVNSLVNIQIRYTADQKLYGKLDYWATGVESISNGKGDCDDYAILKREILTSFGIDQEKLQLKYCKTKKGYSHLVLGYKIGDKNITLDNRSRSLYDNNKEKRVKVIYSIDDNFIYSKGKKIGHNKGFKKFASYRERIKSNNKNLLLASI